MASRKRDDDSGQDGSQKKVKKGHDDSNEAVRTQLVSAGLQAMRATALRSRKGKKPSAWFSFEQDVSRETLQDILGGRGVCTKSTDSAYHVQLSADDFGAVLPLFPKARENPDGFGWTGGPECLWQGPVRIPVDQPYGIYYVQASVVTAEMRWAAGKLTMRIVSVRTCQITGRAPV